jgi:hypothetical protein
MGALLLPQAYTRKKKLHRKAAGHTGGGIMPIR